MKVIAWKI